LASKAKKTRYDKEEKDDKFNRQLKQFKYANTTIFINYLFQDIVQVEVMEVINID
jgi:hypothetical protein